MKHLFYFFTLLSILASTSSRADDCTGNWEIFSSVPYKEVAFPDTAVTYYRYRFVAPSGPIGLKLTGEFPHARYMNFNAYDQTTQDSSFSLPDLSITPDEGSLNPFIPGVDRETTRRSYTVWAVSHGSHVAFPGNTIQMPAPKAQNGKQLVELWYRVYSPDRGKGPLGGVSLPIVTAVNLTTQQSAVCPVVEKTDSSSLPTTTNLPPENSEDEIHFYRTRGIGLYANLDNHYLVTRLRSRQVGVLRFRAPSFPDTGAGGGVCKGGTDVRYWSLCMGGFSTKTSGCVADGDLKVGPDGFVTVVLGPSRIAASVKAKGLNFLSYGNFVFSVLIYRNLLSDPQFAGDIGKVQAWPPEESSPVHSALEHAAHQFLGEYAPRGRSCGEAEFLAELETGSQTLCGVPTL